METSVIDTNTTLVRDVHMYLYDAGFVSNLYRIEDFDHKREYVEVFFLSNSAVNYIKKDIIYSDYSELLEIKKYKYENGNHSAIITYID